MADDVRERERADVASVEFLEVIRAGRLQLDREARGAGMRELLGMDSRHQAPRSPRHQDPPRLSHRERAAVAVNVAKLRKACRSDRGNPSLHERVHECVGPAAKFGRHHVRAEKRRHDVERLLLVEIVQNQEDFQLALPVETVAALGLERRGSVRGKLAQVRAARASRLFGDARRRSFTVERIPPPARAISS